MSKEETTATTATNGGNRAVSYVLIGVLVVVAFFAAYRYASARSAARTAGSTAFAAGQAANVAGGAGAVGSPGAAQTSGSSGVACACCGGSGSSATPVEGSAKIEAGVQKIAVDASSGSYNPNVIKLKAGIPAEITFGQASGCLGQVISQDLGFSEDLTTGPKTVKLAGLSAGTYQFSCGMRMVFGQVVVQ